MKEIRNYEVVVNEGKAKCALIINEDENVLSLLENQNLEYSVDFTNGSILVFTFNSNEPLMVFQNANTDLLRFAFKSNGIPLGVGTVFTNPPQIIYETYISMR